ncbi:MULTISPECIES: PfkB family carbohydrate kinase [unclassified Mycolicibacterium]|uniref:PfkB family carbohydrate kinase n=1 Tax=unclassified Mycolicibacterium TaxID=2636767 RepID=UPI002ED9348F
MSVVVVGQIGREVVLQTPELSETGGAHHVRERRETLGGKGANQAVGLAQLGVPVGLIGVVGADEPGSAALQQASSDGIDTVHVVRRGTTALLVSVIDDAANRLLLEHVPQHALLTPDDVDRSRASLLAADTVSVQLQQPIESTLHTARQGRQAGALVLADGAVDPDHSDELFELIHVFRADADEAEQLAGEPVKTPAAAAELANRILRKGPVLVALAISGVGDLLVWRGGSQLFPLSDAPVVDRTGAGDAFMAGLIAALRRDADPVQAGRLATAAATATVGHLGGRPQLDGLRHA